MALIKCSECNNEISDTSKRCIHCGAKIKKNKPEKGNNKKKIIIGIIGVIVIIAFLSGMIIFFNSNENTYENQSNIRNEKILQIEVTNNYINIRNDKSINSSILGQVHQGEIYDVLEKSEDGLWYLICTSTNIQGYIASKSGDVSYVRELKVEDNNIDNTEEKENTNTNQNTNKKPNNNSNSKPNNSDNKNQNSTVNNDTNNAGTKVELCQKTCGSGYVLKNKDSATCYCEKEQKPYVAKNQIIYDQDGVTITVKGLDYSNKSWVTLDLHITNNSDVDKTIQRNNFPYVNGYDIASNYSVTLLAGTSTTYGMNFLTKYLEKNGSTEIKTIKLNFKIIDWDGTPETLHGAKMVKTPWIDLSF